MTAKYFTFDSEMIIFFLQNENFHDYSIMIIVGIKVICTHTEHLVSK